MSAILRVDDFPGTKPEEFWKHNLEGFKRFDAVLEKHGIEEYVLGVIPKYTTHEHVGWLAQNPRVRVALHGIEHDERFPNEFKGFETEDGIYQKILSAKELLRECNGSGDVVDYIPPHNVIDVKTCNALKRSGFKTVFCGPGTDMYVMENVSGLFFQYSSHPVWYGRSDEMMDRDSAVEKIMSSNGLGHCMTLHWTWEYNIGLSSLDKFLSQISSIFRKP